MREVGFGSVSLTLHLARLTHIMPAAVCINNQILLCVHSDQDIAQVSSSLCDIETVMLVIKKREQINLLYSATNLKFSVKLEIRVYHSHHTVVSDYIIL